MCFSNLLRILFRCLVRFIREQLHCDGTAHHRFTRLACDGVDIGVLPPPSSALLGADGVRFGKPCRGFEGFQSTEEIAFVPGSASCVGAFFVGEEGGEHRFSLAIFQMREEDHGIECFLEALFVGRVTMIIVVLWMIHSED